MAVTITRLSATPHAIRYEVAVTGGAGGSDTISETTLLAGMAEGPLKRFYSKLSTAQRGNLFTGAPGVSNIVPTILPDAITSTPGWAQPAGGSGIVVGSGGDCQFIFELRFIPMSAR